MNPIRIFAVLTLAVTVTACGSSSLVAPSTASMSTETFSGTVDVGGSDSHNFSVGQTGGQVNVTLTAAGPPSTIFMGLGVGTPSGTTCSLLTSNLAQAGTTAQVSGTANAGAYCVLVFDVGNQTGQVAYSVTVTHF